MFIHQPCTPEPLPAPSAIYHSRFRMATVCTALHCYPPHLPCQQLPSGCGVGGQQSHLPHLPGFTAAHGNQLVAFAHAPVNHLHETHNTPAVQCSTQAPWWVGMASARKLRAARRHVVLCCAVLYQSPCCCSAQRIPPYSSARGPLFNTLPGNLDSQANFLAWAASLEKDSQMALLPLWHTTFNTIKTISTLSVGAAGCWEAHLSSSW